jgi:creatinine amidohydrolase
MDGGREIEALLAQTARRLSAMDVERFVVLSGHFAREQLDTIDRFAENWNASGERPRIIATSIDRCPDMQLAPDHAGAFETALLSAIKPDTVAIEQLPSVATAPDHKDRSDPESPLWGITGADPRTIDLSKGAALRDRLVQWLARLSR